MEKTVVASLLKKLDYQFSNSQLLEMALTHRSFHACHNERLEFLGDAILSAVISTELYQRFPHAAEGDLSRMRANLVNATVLADIASELNLGKFIQLGRGELKTGGMRRQSILADCFEALLGAIYLDAGMEAAYSFILHRFQSRLQQAAKVQTIKDAKSRLQEYLQSLHLPLPVYQVLYVTGAAHAQTFHVTCQIEGVAEMTSGNGASRRLAEHEAAEQMLAKLRAAN